MVWSHLMNTLMCHGSANVCFIGHSGTLCDSLTVHNNQYFTTRDADHDKISQNCAKMFYGGFWYDKCHDVNPTGKYWNQPEATNGKMQRATGVHWKCFRDNFYYSLKKMSWQIWIH